MSSSKKTIEQYTSMFAKFASSLSEQQNKSVRGNAVKIEEQEQIVELWRIFYYDTREQEMIAEAREREEHERGY